MNQKNKWIPDLTESKQMGFGGDFQMEPLLEKAARRGVKKKILVIEDDEGVRKWVTHVLTQAGYDCHEAENGEIGSSIAGIFMPDVILCDIEMPEITGHEVLRRLSQNSKTALIPFIFMTARISSADIREGMTLGADDYLTKPINSEDLLNCVRARLDKKQLQDRQNQIKIQRARDTLTRQIFYDTLTDLPKRRLLIKQFREMSGNNFATESFTVLSVGIDNLRQITHAFGSRCEEMVLQEAARRLKERLDPGALLYRGKNDTFNILIKNNNAAEKTECAIKEMIGSLRESVYVDKQVFQLKISVGRAVHEPKNGGDIETALNQAAMARHSAQNETAHDGRSYVPEMHKSVIDLLTMESHLAKALKNKEFQLFYQPQVDIKTLEVKAVEALIRWKSAALGMIAPLQFIPLAEKNGFILPIGRWVLEEGCRQLKRWESAGLNTKMAINISGCQLDTGDLPADVEKAMDQSGVFPGSIELEITESSMMKDINKTLSQMKILKEQGISIAIDDFGSGYSSLSSLKKLPFDTLKIDRSFINGIETHASSAEIVSAIIKMARTLNLKTIAEGVETVEQLECLRNLKCNEYQGYLFSRPLPASEIPPFLSTVLSV